MLNLVSGRRAYSMASKARKTASSKVRQPTKPTPTSASVMADMPFEPTPSTATDKGKEKATVPPLGSEAVRPPRTSALSSPARNEPPLVAEARRKNVKQRNIFESYLVLDWKTRLFFSLGLGLVGLIGLYGGDYLVPETDEEKRMKGEKVEASLLKTTPLGETS